MVKSSKVTGIYIALYHDMHRLRALRYDSCVYLPPTHKPYLPLLPSRKASPPLDRYQLVLLGDRGTEKLPRVFTPRARPKLEPTTSWSQVRHSTDGATTQLSVTCDISMWEISMLQEEIEMALACTDVTQLDVSTITSVNDDPQQVLRLRIRRQAKFLNECRDMKARL